MASIWKHPNSRFLTACYTDKDGKQVKRSTKQTDKRGIAQVLAVGQKGPGRVESGPF
jgi:hypothetical protein